MRSTITIIMLLIFSASVATAAPASKERTATQKEQKNTKKQESIQAAYKLLQSHEFQIVEFDRDSRMNLNNDMTMLYFNVRKPEWAQVISEKCDDYTNTYSMIFYSYWIHMGTYCRLTFNITSGLLEIRYYRNYESCVADGELDLRKNTQRYFNGDYTNILPLDQRQGW